MVPTNADTQPYITLLPTITRNFKTKCLASIYPVLKPHVESEHWRRKDFYDSFTSDDDFRYHIATYFHIPNPKLFPMGTSILDAFNVSQHKMASDYATGVRSNIAPQLNPAIMSVMDEMVGKPESYLPSLRPQIAKPTNPKTGGRRTRGRR